MTLRPFAAPELEYSRTINTSGVLPMFAFAPSAYELALAVRRPGLVASLAAHVQENPGH